VVLLLLAVVLVVVVLAAVSTVGVLGSIAGESRDDEAAAAAAAAAASGDDGGDGEDDVVARGSVETTRARGVVGEVVAADEELEIAVAVAARGLVAVEVAGALALAPASSRFCEREGARAREGCLLVTSNDSTTTAVAIDRWRGVGVGGRHTVSSSGESERMRRARPTRRRAS